MAISRSAKKAYRKAAKAKKRKRRGHWLIIQKGDSFREKCSKLFTQFALCVLIVCIAILLNELRLSVSTMMQNGSLRDIYNSITSFSHSNGQVMDNAQKLLELNPDTVGWVHIDDTNVSLPVVQRRNADGNEYYLDTAFDGSRNKAGTVFLDMRAVLDAGKRSDNLILYGHNQKDKTMFGDLANYKKDIEYYRSHPVVTFNSNYRSDSYKIFAYFVTPVEPYQTSDGVIFDYHNYINLDNRETYDKFIENIMSRSQIITPVDVEYGDKFLTLSTCSNEFEPSRFVVFARQVRTGEDENVDVSQAYINNDAIEPEWDVIYGRK